MAKVTPKPNPGKGKLPKYAIPLAAVAVLAIYLIRKKSGAQRAAGSATEAGSEGLTNQSFIPVTGENVGGAGASSFPSGEGSGGDSAIREFLLEQNRELGTRRTEEKQEETTRRESESNRAQENLQRQQEFYQGVLGNLGTGGGAPASESHGVVSAPVQGGGVSSKTPTKAPTTPKGEQPTLIKCGNGCQGHKYKSGKTECQVRNKQHQCVWT